MWCPVLSAIAPLYKISPSRNVLIHSLPILPSPQQWIATAIRSKRHPQQPKVTRYQHRRSRDGCCVFVFYIIMNCFASNSSNFTKLVVLRFLLISELQPISVTSRDSKRPYQSTYHIPPKRYSVGSLKWRHKWPHRLCGDMHIPWSSYSGNTSIELLACHDNVINQQSSDRGFFRFIARQTATADPSKMTHVPI